MVRKNRRTRLRCGRAHSEEAETGALLIALQWRTLDVIPFRRCLPSRLSKRSNPAQIERHRVKHIIAVMGFL